MTEPTTVHQDNWTTDLPAPERAMAICAHPDDVEFQAGATFAKWAAAGTELAWVVCTDGARGSWEPNTDVKELVALRQKEQRAAAAALGADQANVSFLAYPDGELHDSPAERAEVVRAIRAFRPHVLLGHDPWQRYRLHPDHRFAGWLAVDGLVSSRERLYRPDLGPNWRPDTLLLWEADEPNHVETLSERALIAKLDALKEHHSQYRSTMDISDPADPEQVRRFEARIRGRAASVGQRVGAQLGESFRRIGDGPNPVLTAG